MVIFRVLCCMSLILHPMIKIGENLRKVRNKKQYSLEYVATTLNVSVTTIQKMETGNKHLCLKLFENYCKLLEVDPGFIFSNMEKTKKDNLALKIGYLILETLGETFSTILSQLSDDEIIDFLRNKCSTKIKNIE